MHNMHFTLRTIIYKLSCGEDVAYESDRSAVATRFIEIQKLVGDEKDNVAFAARLNAAAKELGFEQDWTANRVSKVRNVLLGTDAEDAYVIARVDPKDRGPTYVTHGVAVDKGKSPWAVLAQLAKKAKSA